MGTSPWVFLTKGNSIAPLISARIIFGCIMLFGTVRFYILGWIEEQYIKPIYHFRYFGFEWLPYPSAEGIYLLFIGLFISSLAFTFGLFYRISATAQFVFFTYIELLDKTYYLNHYYGVSLFCFIFIWLPAHRLNSLDVLFGWVTARLEVPRWCIWVLQFQLAVIYFYAGIAKINSHWLWEGLPLKIWLPAKDTMPILGPIFRYETTAYVFSWLGMVFDTTIILFLCVKKTRIWAYVCVIIFHAMTGYLFQIGIFPLVMSGLVLIFFSAEFHERWLGYLGFWPKIHRSVYKPRYEKSILGMFLLFAFFQLLFPFRYLLYPGNVFWTEEGYRFSWRVMLMEKAGSATFYIKDGKNGKEGFVDNSVFLNEHQEKQMAMQPDMILQFGQFLGQYCKKIGYKDPWVRVEANVTLNGAPSQLLVNPDVNLMELKDSWEAKKWINPYE